MAGVQPFRNRGPAEPRRNSAWRCRKAWCRSEIGVQPQLARTFRVVGSECSRSEIGVQPNPGEARHGGGARRGAVQKSGSSRNDSARRPGIRRSVAVQKSGSSRNTGWRHSVGGRSAAVQKSGSSRTPAKFGMAVPQGVVPFRNRGPAATGAHVQGRRFRV